MHCKLCRCLQFPFEMCAIFANAYNIHLKVVHLQALQNKYIVSKNRIFGYKEKKSFFNIVNNIIQY
jgi:hypothetical protein